MISVAVAAVTVHDVVPMTTRLLLRTEASNPAPVMATDAPMDPRRGDNPLLINSFEHFIKKVHYILFIFDYVFEMG